MSMSPQVYRETHPGAVIPRAKAIRLAKAIVAAMAIAATALLAGTAPAGAADVRVEATRRLMGVPWRIVVHADSGDAAEAAAAAAFAEVARLERVLSDYDPDSELSRLSAGAPTAGPVAVGDDLWRALRRAAAIRDATDGAFDPAVGPLTTLWRQARRTGRLPRPDRLAAARGAVGPGALAVAADRREVSLPLAGTRLDLGGIGMGYAADRALEVLAERGVASAMIDASGDIAVSAPPPAAGGWRIGLPPAAGEPAEILELSRAAVTTSGDAFQAVVIDGVRYSHVVDPRTGVGVRGPGAVTVIAPDCTTADALATALSVLGPERGLQVLAAFPGCAARFIWSEDGAPHEARSPGWPAAPPGPPGRTAAGPPPQPAQTLQPADRPDGP